jgi:hypothetical protein
LQDVESAQETIMFDATLTHEPGIHNDLAPHFDALLSSMKLETQVYQELLILISRERKILLNPTVEKIQECNARKETLILKARMLEEGRMNVARKIGQLLDLDPQDLNISGLLPHMDEVRGAEMKACQTTLRVLLRQIGEGNRSTSSLVEASLRSISGSISFLQDLMFGGPTYAGTGGIKPQRGNGKLLCTEC